MDSAQIESVLRNDKHTVGLSQIGVYPCDKTPKTVTFPSAFVFNTDSSKGPGRHWVAIYYDRRGHGTYFDSLGGKPFPKTIESFFLKHGKYHNWINKAVQGRQSNSCGHYCLQYLIYRARGHSSANIIKRWVQKSVGGYDDKIKCLVTTKYEYLPRIESECYNQTSTL